jgi:IS30 family transposase
MKTEPLGKHCAELRHTVTFDNGKEFREHDLLAEMNLLSVRFGLIGNDSFPTIAHK